MGTTTLHFTGNEALLIGVPTDTSIQYIPGAGSIYTIVASGTTGQSAVIEGSIDGSVWALLSTLTVGAANAPDWDVIRHTFPMMRVSGTASVKLSRGS